MSVTYFSELCLASLVVAHELYLYSDGLDVRGVGSELFDRLSLNRTALVSKRRGICSEVVSLFKKQNGALLLFGNHGSIIALSGARLLLSGPQSPLGHGYDVTNSGAPQESARQLLLV
jgi:hypothetical protein